MSGKTIYTLSEDPIVCHAFNKDRNRVAICPNNSSVQIFKKNGGKWELESTLKEHSQLVTGIDWAPNSNRIVTSGMDRNSYVWEEIESGTWKPTLVILRINRAATCVKWSPKEDKFAVGSGARLISICYFEKENDWWVSKHIKKPFRSTVKTLDWHPNNVLLVAGSCAFKVRVFSAYIKEIEGKPEATNWGKKMPFGAVMADIGTSGGGWVHGAAFSPDGSKIVWVTHSSTICVATMLEGAKEPEVATLAFNHQPLLSCIWLSDTTIVAAGHNFLPMVYMYNDDKTITSIGKLDEPSKASDDDTVSAMQRFRNLDKKATESKDAKSLTTHTNIIKEINVYGGEPGAVDKISTCAMDGKIVIWDIKCLSTSIAGLTI